MAAPPTYSQSGEDSLIWDYFGRKTTGFFVEVGANDPQRLSQTFLLEENGWEGILIEPQSACCERLRKLRTRSKVFQVACGAPGRKDAALLHLATTDALSSLERQVNSAEVTYRGTELVQVITLDEVLEQVGNPRIDFISIDVEGSELDVLKGFSLAKHAPALLMVEDHVHSLDVHRHLSKNDYKLVKRTGSNNWYVPREHRCHLTSVWERWKLFRKMWLGTPLRAFRSAKTNKNRQ